MERFHCEVLHWVEGSDFLIKLGDECYASLPFTCSPGEPLVKYMGIRIVCSQLSYGPHAFVSALLLGFTVFYVLKRFPEDLSDVFWHIGYTSLLFEPKQGIGRTGRAT